MCSPVDSELLSQRQVLKDESTSASEERSECGCGGGEDGGHRRILAVRKSPVISGYTEYSRTTAIRSFAGYLPQTLCKLTKAFGSVGAFVLSPALDASEIDGVAACDLDRLIETLEI